MANFRDASFSSTRSLGSGTQTKRTLADRSSDIVNVLDFGAVSDPNPGSPTTDSTTAIQNAINWTVAKPGRGIIYFPIGNYHITSSLTISASHVQITFQGAGHNIADYSSTLLFGHFNGPLIDYTSDSGGNASGKIFRDMGFENTYGFGTGATPGGMGIRIGTGGVIYQNIRISNCYFLCYRGIYIIGQGCNIIDNCMFTGGYTPGDGSIGLYHGGGECSVISPAIQSMDVGLYFSSNGTGYSVTGGRCEVSGIGIWLGGPDLTGAGGSGINGFSINGCAFEACRTCIRVENATAGLIAGCRGIGSLGAAQGVSAYGIHMYGGSDILIVGNSMSGGFCAGAFYGEPGRQMNMMMRQNVGGGGGNTLFPWNNADPSTIPSGATVIPIYFGSTGLTMPPWVVSGAVVVDSIGAFQSGTLIAPGGVAATQITITKPTTAPITFSHASSTYNALYFGNPATGDQFGNFYIGRPIQFDIDVASQQTSISRVTTSASLDVSYYSEIEFFSAGAITFTIPNDTAFPVLPAEGYVYKFVNTGAGTVTFNTSAITLQGTLAPLTTGGVAFLRRCVRTTNTWLGYT